MLPSEDPPPQLPKCCASSLKSSTPSARGQSRDVCPHPAAALLSWSRSLGGAVPPLALTPSFSPSRSWSGPWSRTARTRSPPPCTPPLPTRARRWAPTAPVHPPRRHPGELQPLAAARGNARGAAGHEPPVREGSGISLLGLGEPKPRGMNEAHSWLNNIRKAPRREQLRGPESRSWSEWNGKNQLLGAGSA